jgi:hypothetical protein
VERRISVIRRARICLALLVLFAVSGTAATGDRVVLIVPARADFAPLDLAEVRKLFLGFPVIRNGVALHPLRNQSDARLDEVFLQNIVGMSDITYDRRVLSLMLQQGRTPPPSVRSRQQLLASMASDPFAVSFAWESEVAASPQVKILGVLWHE